MMRRERHPRGYRVGRGLTLVEVLLVIALIGMLTGAIVFGSGMFSSSRKRAAATMIMTGVRLGLTRANATGKPVRMVFDLDEQRVMLEESIGSQMLREKDELSGGAEAATDAERRAREEADRILEGPQAPRARFQPVSQFGFDADDPAKGRELGKGIAFREVQTEHDEEPRSEGRAYLYFWPGGGTERAAIQVQEQGEQDPDRVLTVMVSPLTGRARIESGPASLPQPRGTDEDYSEREEP